MQLGMCPCIGFAKYPTVTWKGSHKYCRQGAAEDNPSKRMTFKCGLSHISLGKNPLKQFLEAATVIRLGNLNNSVGMDPLKALSLRSTFARARCVVGEKTPATDPCNRLLWSWRICKFLILESEVGMVPVSRFPFKLSTVRFFSADKISGTVPVKRLSCMDRTVRLDSADRLLGIRPTNLQNRICKYLN